MSKDMNKLTALEEAKKDIKDAMEVVEIAIQKEEELHQERYIVVDDSIPHPHDTKLRKWFYKTYKKIW